MPLETEIKIRIYDVPAMRRKLRKLGFRIYARRVFESNIIFDTPVRDLVRKGALIRMRRVRARSIVTYKGPSKVGRHKSREEIETLVADPKALVAIFARLGLNPVFRYEKYRTEYEQPGRRGIVTVDETPVGDYLEVEGSPKWIDIAAGELGFSRADYITASYAAIYVQYCRDQGIRPDQMIFRPGRSAKGKVHRRIPETKNTNLP